MARVALFQFGARTVGASNTWNDFDPADFASGAPKDLVDYDDGTTIADDGGVTWTGVRLNLQAVFFTGGTGVGVNAVGTSDLAWCVEAEHLDAGLKENTFGTPATLRISGLDNAKTYDLQIASSFIGGSEGYRESRFTVNGGTPQSIDSSSNSTTQVLFSSISPSSTNIDIDIEPHVSGGQATINAMRLTENDAASNTDIEVGLYGRYV